MAPIRVGIIGLSAKPAALAPGAWATMAVLPSFQNSPEYEIVALCNSSLDAARRSVAFHNLPASTRTYDDPEALGVDPDVDLVVVSVNVTKHRQLALPALSHKKPVFVEWPLGKSVQEAEQMAELARASNLKTVVGLQALGDRLLVKMKEIIDSGEIGEIRSTSVLGTLLHVPPQFWVQGMEQYLDIESGANSFHVVFGHFLASFTHVVGDFDLDTLSSVLKTDVTEVAIYTPDRAKIATPSHPKTAPDQVLAQGKLRNGALASLNFRTTPATVDDVAIRWVISGTKGEIEVTSPRSSWQGYTPDRKLRVRLFGQETREIDLEGAELGVAAGMASSAVNTALILDAFAKGRQGEFADFEEALKSHRLLEEILKRSGLY